MKTYHERKTENNEVFQFSSIQSLSRVLLFATPRTAAPQACLSFTISLSLLKLMSVESVMSSNHLILCCPLLLPSIFPSISLFHPVCLIANPCLFLIPKMWMWNNGVSAQMLHLISFSFVWGFFCLFCAACRILVPWSEIKPAPPALEAQSLNHWTTREVPVMTCFKVSQVVIWTNSRKWQILFLTKF